MKTKQATINIRKTHAGQQHTVSEMRYRMFVANNPDSVYCYDITRPVPVNLPAKEQLQNLLHDSVLAECNEVLATRYGYESSNDILGKSFAEITTLQGVCDLSILERFIENGYHLTEAEVIAKDKNKNVIVLSNSAFGIIENDCLVRVWGTSRDITEKKLAEKKLAESELRYKMFISQSTEAIFCYESSTPVSIHLPAEEQLNTMKEYGVLAECNDLVAIQYGKTKASEIIGLKLRDAISFDNETNINTLKQLINSGYRIVDGETQVIDEQGKLHILSNNLVGIIENDHIIRIWGTARNITRQRKTQNALEESELRYRMFIAQSTEAIWRLELTEPVDIGLPPGKQVELIMENSCLAECNDCMAKMYGHENHTRILNTSFKNIFTAANWQDSFRFLLQFVKNDYILGNTEIVWGNKNGNQKTISSNLVGIIENGCLIRIWGTQRDITEQRKAELNNRYLAGLVENVSDAIYSCDMDLTIISWNKAAEKIYGVKAAEAIGKKLNDFLKPNYQDGTRENVINEVTNKGVWKGEVNFSRPGETDVVTVLSSVSILNDEYGRPHAFIINSKDISERKRFEKELFLSNERYDLVNKATNEAIWDADIIENKLLWGEGFKTLFGYDPSVMEVTTDFWIDKIHPEDRYKAIRTFFDFSPESTPHNVYNAEYRFMKADGTYAVVSDKAFLIRTADGRPARMVGAVKDITREKELEAQLVKNEVDKQRLITMATINGQEKEKGEISKELHDNVNQVVSSTKLYLEVIKNNPDENLDLLQKAIENLNIILQENRRISKSLAPPTLGHLGFSEAVADLMEDIQLSGTFEINFIPDRNIDKKLSDDLKLALYRITQEAINNIVKYAGATKAAIALYQQNENLLLTIEDNGKGFDTGQKRKGIGITNIINRAALYNGTLKIESAPGQGTKLKITIPFKN